MLISPSNRGGDCNKAARGLACFATHYFTGTTTINPTYEILIWQLIQAAFTGKALALAVVAPLVVVLVFNLRRSGRRKPNRCPRCGYDVTMLTSNQCPECGNDLTKSGICAAGEPRLRVLAFRTVMWMALYAAIGFLLTGPWAPQPYAVAIYDSVPPYEPGEQGRRFSVSVRGMTIRWPWQREVTADKYQAQLYTYDPAGAMASKFIAIQHGWPDQYMVCDLSPYTTKIYDKPLDAATVAAFLKSPDGELPLRTAERVMRQISQPTVTGNVSSPRPPFATRLHTTAWAGPDPNYAPVLRWLTAYTILLLWLISLLWISRRWRRPALRPWPIA